MFLLASKNNEQLNEWREGLANKYTLYETDCLEVHALELCLRKISIEIILLDLALLGNDGLHTLAELHDIQPSTRFIVFTENFNHRDEISAILFGAFAYIHITTPIDLIKTIISAIQQDEVWVDRQFVTRLIAEIQDIAQARHREAHKIEKCIGSMTPRETQIATLVASGATNRRIAEKLSISERTVKAHLGMIFKKIGISDRLQLALYINRHHRVSDLQQSNFSSKK